MDHENRPNRSWCLPKSTKSVQSDLSKVAFIADSISRLVLVKSKFGWEGVDRSNRRGCRWVLEQATLFSDSERNYDWKWKCTCFYTTLVTWLFHIWKCLRLVFHKRKTFPFKVMFVRCHSKFVCHLSFLGNDCISFYGNHVTIPFKVTIPSFQIHFVQQKHNVQMAAVMMQVVPSFYSVYSTKSVHICANTYEKYLVSKD